MSRNILKLGVVTVLLSTFALAVEEGSGYYAKDCKRPGGGYNIIINKNGTATVETDPDVYENVLTSYSFFGNDTPSDFHVAILFDMKKSPVPTYKGDSWIEIWKTPDPKKNGYLALINGRASKALQKCTGVATGGADGPDFFKVRGVHQNDTLNIHREPHVNSKVVGEINFRGDCLKNLGCKGGLTLNESMNLSEKEKAEIIKKRPRWCKIAFDGVEGWVFAEYIIESGCTKEIRP